MVCSFRQGRRQKGGNSLLAEPAVSPAVEALARLLTSHPNPAQTVLNAVNYMPVPLEVRSRIQSSLARVSASCCVTNTAMPLDVALSSERALYTGNPTKATNRASNKLDRYFQESLSPRNTLFSEADQSTSCLYRDSPTPRHTSDSIDMRKAPMASPLAAVGGICEEATGVVTDAEVSSRQETSEQIEAQDILLYLAEAVQLEASISGYARKARFNTYPLNGPVSLFDSGLVDRIRSGIMALSVRSPSKHDCRVYMSQRETYTWFHIVSSQHVYQAVVKRNEAFVALCLNGRSGKLVLLSTLQAALVSSVQATVNNPEERTVQKCLPGLSGRDPIVLLDAATAISSQTAVGRFAEAAIDSDPLDDIQTTATCNLLDSDAEAVQPCHLLPQLVREADDEARLLTITPAGAILNHDASRSDARKRKFDTIFGRIPPGRTCIKWEIAEGPSGERCRFTIRGSNAFEGMKALVDAGHLQIDDSLPDHVRDAAHLDPVIKVSNGVVLNRPSAR